MEVGSGVVLVQVHRLNGNFHQRDAVAFAVEQHVHLVVVAAPLGFQQIRKLGKAKGPQPGLGVCHFRPAKQVEGHPGQRIAHPGSKRHPPPKGSRAQHQRTRMGPGFLEHPLRVLGQVLPIGIHGDQIGRGVIPRPHRLKGRLQGGPLPPVLRVVENHHRRQGFQLGKDPLPVHGAAIVHHHRTVASGGDVLHKVQQKRRGLVGGDHHKVHAP